MSPSNSFKFMNFGRLGGFKPKLPRTIDISLKDGTWTADTAPGPVMGQVCKMDRYRATSKEKGNVEKVEKEKGEKKKRVHNMIKKLTQSEEKPKGGA